VFYTKLSEINMKAPKEVTTYCPRCKTQQSHAVAIYKAGKRRALAGGERSHERKKMGYGGQKYALQRKFAKTTRKQTFKLKCKTCGYTRHKKGMRLKKLSLD